MANVKISELASATSLDGTETVPVVQGGATKKSTVDLIASRASVASHDHNTDYVPLGLFTTQGDIAYATASGAWARLAKGTAAQALKMNSGATAPEWSSGGMALVGETELGSAATYVEFTGIPSTFKDLFIVARLRTDRSAVNDEVAMRVGSAASLDSAAGNYTWHQYRLGDTNLETSGFASQDAITLGSFWCPAATASSGMWGQLELTVLDYSNATYYRQIQGQVSGHPASATRRISVCHGQWHNTADALARIRIYPVTGPNFIAGSKLRLYGVA